MTNPRREFAFSDSPDFCERPRTPAPVDPFMPPRLFKAPSMPECFYALASLDSPLRAHPWPNGHKHPPEPEAVKLAVGQRVMVRYWFNLAEYDSRTGLAPEHMDATGHADIEAIRGWLPARFVTASKGNKKRGMFIVYHEVGQFPFWCGLSSEWVRQADMDAGPIPKWACPRLF